MVAPAVDLGHFKQGAEAVARLTAIIERDHRMMHVDVASDGTYHVLSWSRPGVVYEVIGDACHCEGAQAGLLCWHVVAAELDRIMRRPSVAPMQPPTRDLTRLPIAELAPDEREDEAARLTNMLFGD